MVFGITGREGAYGGHTEGRKGIDNLFESVFKNTLTWCRPSCLGRAWNPLTVWWRSVAGFPCVFFPAM